jgi:uncharacterized protein YceK
MIAQRLIVLAVLIGLCGCDSGKKGDAGPPGSGGQRARRGRKAYKDRLARWGRRDLRANKVHRAQQSVWSALIVCLTQPAASVAAVTKSS